MREVAEGKNTEVSVGMDSLTEFLKKQYLESYIAYGGSKIKFVTGRPGSGKTHMANLMRMEADSLGYKTVVFSAKEVWLHDFREIYLEILHQCNIEQVLEGCANRIIIELGCQDFCRPELDGLFVGNRGGRSSDKG